jgi:hypothetical protein
VIIEMKKVSHNIRKRFEEDRKIILNKNDTYVSMKFKLCNYIYRNMSVDEIKNEIFCIRLKKVSTNSFVTYIKNIIDVIVAAISSLVTVGITCYCANATLSKNNNNLKDIIKSINEVLDKTFDAVLWFMIIFVILIIIVHIWNITNKNQHESVERYNELKLSCLNQVLEIKLKEKYNQKYKADYTQKHFKVNVKSIK